VARRTKTMLLAAACTLLVAAPAEAALVYVTKPAADDAHVWVARDDGTQARKVGPGHSPKISPDGRWVAWVKDGSPDQVMMRLADRSRKARVVIRSSAIGDLQFSPDSKLLAFVVGRRLFVYDIRERDEVKAASGSIRGFSFSPDSGSVAFGTAGTSDAFDAPSDLYSFSLDDEVRNRITRDRKSLNPLWGPAGILHDRMRARGGDAPSYNVFTIKPDGGSLRRITTLRIPSLMSGLVPLDQSADGTRLLANFVGQDTQVAFRVNVETGRAKALDDDFENGLVGFDLTADGRTVLGHTGGPDPTARHDVVTVPYGGGDPEVLVRRAAFPDWSR
jgi:WD40 repeat protein